MGLHRSPASNRSRSSSAESNRSVRSNGSEGSNRSASVSRSRSRSASGSRGSRRSRSGSAGSVKSNVSAHSNHSGNSARSGSKTPSQRSRNRSCNSRSRSRSAGSNKSGQSIASVGTNRSSSRSRSRSHSGSRASNRSRSGSVDSGRSNRSRSRSAQSNKSAHSGRSGSKTPSNKSRSQSRSRSRSRSRSGSAQSRSRSRSNSPVDGSPKAAAKVSDSENDDKDADATDLFGDADDISSDEDKAKESKDRDERSDDDRPQPGEQDDERMSGEEREEEQEEDKEVEPEPIPETRIDVKIPKISCDLGKEIHFVKLPNFLSVETRPFDPDTYEDEIDEEETLDEEGRARLKLKVENTIRWREEINKEGDFEKHSNARLVRWSDGSLSLHLGSEIFDVYKQPLQGDHNHLFIRQGTGLQGQAVFRTKLSFRPHSTESFTHRKMTLSLADRSQKTTGIKILSQVGVDPDQDRKTLLKKEEEKLRQTFRPTKPRKRGDGGRSHVGQVYREEEGSEDEGAISLNAIKNKYKSGAHLQSKGGAIYSSDEEGSDFEARRMKKLDKPKALKDSESSDESD